MTPGEAVVELEGTEPGRGRVDSAGQVHRSLTTHAVLRRWHKACLEDFERQNEAYRAQVADDRDQMIRDICAATGLDYDEVMAHQEDSK